MTDITITIPQIDPAMYADLETTQSQAYESELAAIRAIREKFSAAAKHGQNVKTASWKDRVDSVCMLRKDGKLVKGWEIVRDFSFDDSSANSGSISGTSLWLTADGWLEQEFNGAWSRYQDSVDWWCAGDTTPQMENVDWDRGGGGYTKYVSDAVAGEYKLEDILTGLAKVISESKDRVPKRIAKLQEQIAVAERVAAALA
jgi:hypothetical protein